ncbi:MAG TPA: cytochrome c [Vicinamibacterales bacterium]|nr:cytochrome c [Vicinamibacterales bacterium]
MSVKVSTGALAFSGVLLAGGLAVAAEVPKTVTFSKDVAPIFQAKCQTCHEPGSIAPMSLRTFQEARPWARSIKQRVESRQMPPWHIDRSVGVQHFKNDMSLTDEQVETIVRWVDQGAVQGNPADMPPLKPVSTSLVWIGERDGYGPPDLVVKSPEYTMPAFGQDQWWRPMVDIEGLTEPRWVRMVEIRPSNIQGRKILHHSIAHVVMDPNDVDADAVNRGIGGPRGDDPADLVNARPSLMEWAIGKGYDRYMDNAGKLIKPGQKISWDQHVHAAGEVVTAGSELGIWLYPKGQEPKYRTHLVGFTGLKEGAIGLDIPPNSVAHTEGFTVLKENTVITNFQPHFHLRGKAMQVEAIFPDGTTQVISYVSNFNFNWMTNYIYAEDAAPAFPKGTIIHVTAFYDNTKANKNNPDPDQWVGYGDRTVDEMAHAWMNVFYLNDAEYQEWLAKRGGKPGIPTAAQTQQQQQ